MRIHFKSTLLPKKAAKRIFVRFGSADKASPFKFRLADAQEIAAYLLGYESWHSLHATTKAGTHAPSDVDEECNLDTQTQRLNYQAARLAKFTPVIESERRLLAIEFRVSSKNSKNPNLVEQLHARNSIVFGGDSALGIQEWRFQPSINSRLNRQVTFEICDQWEFGKVTFPQHIENLSLALAHRPEDPHLIEEILRVSLEVGRLDPVEHRLDGFEHVLLGALPQGFPKTGKAIFDWANLANRTWIRSCYWLAVCFYEAGRYGKAEIWFKFTMQITAVMDDGCKAYLKDLALSEPTGAVNVWD